MKLKEYLKIPPGYYRDLAMAESSGGKHKKAFRINEKGEKEFVGTASGDYQFVEGTWSDVVKKMGKDWTMDDRFDSEKSHEAVKFFTEENERYLKKKLGRDPNKTELYSAHHFGNNGANKFLNKLKEMPDADSSEAFSAKVLNANPHLQNKTVLGAYNELAKRIKGEAIKETQQKKPIKSVDLFKSDNYESVSKDVDNTTIQSAQIPEQKTLTEKDIRNILDKEKQRVVKQKEQSFLQKYKNVLRNEGVGQEKEIKPQEDLSHLYDYLRLGKDDFYTQGFADGGKYVVKKGDTLSEIAKNNDMTMKELLELNPSYEKNIAMIDIGDSINVRKYDVELRERPFDVSAESTYVMKKIDPNRKRTPSSLKNSVEIENNKRKEKNIGDDIVNMIPLSVRQFVYDTLGGEGEINEKDLSEKDYNALKKTVIKNMSRNKMKVDYDDWRDARNMTKDTRDDDMNLSDPYSNLQKTLGQASIEVDDNGDIYVKDKYNFNDAGGKNNRYKNEYTDSEGLLPIDSEQTLSNNVYRLARNYKTVYGRKEGGSPVKIYMGNVREVF